MNTLKDQTNWAKVAAQSIAFLIGVGFASILQAGDYFDPASVDPWCGGDITPTPFEAPIRVALDGERESFNPDNLVSTLPLPIPSPAYAQVREIGRLFNQIAVQMIEARSSQLKEIFDPLPDPDPPNLDRQVINNFRNALLFLELLEAKIDKAQADGVLSEEGQGKLGLYVDSTRDLIETLPLPIP